MSQKHLQKKPPFAVSQSLPPSPHTVPLLAPMVWVRKLKHYAVTNIIADILIVAPLMYIMSYEADMMRERGLGPKVEAFRWATCLPFFGTTVYSMEGISMIIPIEQSMKRKEDLPKVWCLSALVMAVSAPVAIDFCLFLPAMSSFLSFYVSMLLLDCFPCPGPPFFDPIACNFHIHRVS